jgi:integration host factor subunit beta
LDQWPALLVTDFVLIWVYLIFQVCVVGYLVALLERFFNNREQVMTKSELIEYITEKQNQLTIKDVEMSVKLLLDYMSDILASGERIEIRGFGSFSLHYRAPRTGRNPKTGDAVVLEGKYVPHFKPGKEMRDRVNESISKQ